MQWIIFQAAPQGEQQYQMYVAKLQRRRATGSPAPRQPIRISPEPSRNTCGYFSPDGKSLIFASTAGKEDPTSPPAATSAQGRNYRWAFPTGMEIFRADDWQAGRQQAPGPAASVDLATHAAHQQRRLRRRVRILSRREMDLLHLHAAPATATST